MTPLLNPGLFHNRASSIAQGTLIRLPLLAFQSMIPPEVTSLIEPLLRTAMVS